MFNKTSYCDTYQPQIWRPHICANCFQLEIEHDGIPNLLYSPRSPLKNGTNYPERTYPNGILKRKNLKPLTPEFPPRTFKSNQLKFDWLTPQPSNKINKFDLSPVRKPLKPLLRKEPKHPIPPLHMDILMQSRTEPDGQLDESATNSPKATNSTKTDSKNKMNAPMHIKISTSANSPARTHSSNSPTTPLVLPYAVSVVNDQEAEDFNAANKLEQTFNEKHHAIVTRKHSLTTPTHNGEAFSPISKRNFSNLRVSPIHDTSPIHPPVLQTQAKRRELSISTDSGTEMEATTVSPPIHSFEGPFLDANFPPQPETSSFKKFFGPISRRRHRSDGVKSSFSVPDSPTSIRSIKGTVTACLPIRLPKWSHKRKPRKPGKETKSPRRKELCIDDIHILPPDSTMSQMLQQGKFPNEIMASPTHLPNGLLSGSPSKINTPSKSPQTSFPTSPVKSDSFSPIHSKSSHQYLPLNLVPMSANNSKDLQTSFPFGFEHPIESLPLTKSKFPNDQSDLSDERESIFGNRPPLLKSETSPGPEVSTPKKKKPPTKPIRSVWTDSTHLLKYKSKSEMNLGMADTGVSTPFYMEMQKYQQQRKQQRTNSLTPCSVKPEIPAFPPNVSQEEVKRSLQNVSANSSYMPPNTYVTPNQPTNRYNRHVRTNSMYENVENMPSQQVTGEYHELPNRLVFDTVSTGDLLETPPKIPQIGTASSITTVDSTGSAYVQMRFDQSISDDIGQAVTSYKKIVSDNSKLVKVMSDQLYHQYMQTFNWETIDWDQVGIVDDQQSPLNISILVSQGELQKEFSLWPKQFNEDDVAERAFQSAQIITRSLPRNPYILHVHSLIHIPFELKEKCHSLNEASTACVVDHSRAGTLANYLTDHKPLLDIDPERYERNVTLLLIQILSGVAHMHRHKVVHRDLNLSDILLSKEKDDDELLQVKISGFTYALHRSGPPRAQPFLYSFEELQWLGGDETKLPPEINNAQNNLPELNYSGTDSFAVGCIIYEMMHEHSPFEDQNLITKAYTSQDLPNLPQKSKYSVWLQNVAKGLLEMNLQRRLDASFACTILQLVIFDAEQFIVDADINEKKVKALISDLQGKFLHRMIEKSSTTLLTGKPLELNALEKIELNFLVNSQPYNIVRAIKHFQNHS